MKYYRFKTFTTSYYFPKITQKTRFLYGLYSPFGGFLSRIYWFLFKHSNIIRMLTCINEDNLNFPYKLIKTIDTTNSVMSFNMGSPGIEQKISMLGWNKDNHEPFFAKFSQKPRAIELTKNEKIIYTILSKTGLVPRILEYKEGKNYAYLKTEYIKGHRPKDLVLTEKIMNLSLKLKDYHLSNVIINEDGLHMALSHGDFCPWNMLEDNNNIKLIDWELAADRPLGYDIFTYIAQTSLLFNPKLSFTDIIKENETIVKKYFSILGIKDYIPYIHAFTKARYNYEINKGNTERAKCFK